MHHHEGTLLSQWCAHDGPYEGAYLDGGKWKPTPLDQHQQCKSQRWHDGPDPDHVAPDEIESWYCECNCHT